MLDEVLIKHLIRKETLNMLTVNPVKFNTIRPIAFREGNLNNITPNVAILSLQNPNANINFENDLSRTKKADMVQSQNMFGALAAKLRKTYDILFSQNNQNLTESTHHIYYLD